MLDGPALARADAFRLPPPGLDPVPWKEWQHFVVHAGDVQVIVNVDVLDDVWASRPARAVRLIVIARTTAGWEAEVTRFPADAVRLASGAFDARLGPHRVWFDGDAYRLHLQPTASVAMDLRLLPVSSTLGALDQPLAPGSALSWLVVPRLAVEGELEVAGAAVDTGRGVAYHDHNWGRFRWGDDLAWEWACALPEDPACPWTVVFMRLADRARRVARRQALYVWHERDRVAVFRDRAYDLTLEGRHGRPAALTVPGTLRLLAREAPSDIPATAVAEARAGDDHVAVRLDVEDHVRIAVPDEHGYEGVTLLNEARGRVQARGQVRGRALTLDGHGILELLRH